MQKATRQQTKDHNTRLVLRTIYHGEAISRADIARRTRLTRPTISRIVSDLIDDHFVVEKGLGPSAGGKPPMLLDFAYDDHQLLAIDLGSQEFRGAVMNLAGEIVFFHQQATKDRKGQAALELVFELIDKLQASARKPILGIAVGTPGLTDPNRGIVREAVNLEWHNLPLADLLAQRFEQPVYVANDSHMAAIGEYTFGSQTGTDNLVVIKIGQGIGAGIVLKGQSYYGDGYGAGEIGHVVVKEGGKLCTCGNHGCLETTSSIPAILQQVRQAAAEADETIFYSDGKMSWQDLVKATQVNDELSCRIVAEAGRYLGVAIAILIATLSIHNIVIAGRTIRLGQLFLSSAKEEARNRALPSMVADTNITFSELGRNVVILGSAATILNGELGVI